MLLLVRENIFLDTDAFTMQVTCAAYKAILEITNCMELACKLMILTIN